MITRRSFIIRFFMFLGLLSLLGVYTAYADGIHKNLLHWDTSFETGKNAWVCWSNAYPDNWSIDSTTAFHGAKSLRFTYPTKLEAYRFLLDKDREYTFSCYLKTDKPGAKCNVIMFTRDPNGKDAVHGVVGFECSREWKRVVAKILKQSFTTDDWRLIISSTDNATFWLDAFQLEEGSLSDYNYQETLSVATGEPANVYIRDQKTKTFRIGLYNPSRTDCRRIVRYTVVDFNGKAIQNGSNSVLLHPGEHSELIISLPKGLDNGFYTIAASLNDGSRKLYRDRISFCMVPPVAPVTDSAKAFFGTADYQYESSEEIFTALSRIGSKWFNVPFWAGWRNIEPVKGEYHWDMLDRQVAFVKKHGMNMIGYIFDFIPKWAASDNIDSRPRDMADFEEFIYQLVSRYKNDIKIWDVLSEPDLAIKDAWGPDSVKAYAEFLRAAYRGAHRADPDCTVVGCSVSNSDTSTGYPFTRAVLKELGGEIDGMAPHPYTYPRSFGPGRNAIGPVEYGIRKHLEEAGKLVKGKHLWVGEYGFDYHCLPDSEYARDHAAYMAQSLIIARSLESIERFLWFTAYYHYWSDAQESYGLWTNDLDPMPAVAVFATAVNLLNDVSTRTRLDLGKSAEAYVFSSGNRSTTAVWASNQARDVSLIIPKSLKIRVINTVGTDITRRISKNKNICIKLDKWPVYIVGSNMSMSEMQKLLSFGKLEMAMPLKAGIFVPDKNTISVKLTEMTKAARNIVLKIDCPLALRDAARKVLLKPDEIKTVDFKIDGPGFIGEKDYNIGLKIDFDGKSAVINKKLNFTDCPRMRGPVTVDGNLDEWLEMKPFTQLDQSNIMPPDMIVHKFWNGNDDLSATVYLAYDESNLYFAANVADDKHFNLRTGSMIWNGDALQIGIDSNGSALSPAEGGTVGYSQNDAEIGFALTSSGEQVYQWFPNTGNPNKVKCRIKRDGQHTIYEAAIPFTSLPNPERWGAGMVMGFSMVILDDDDGSGAKYRLELSPGIVNRKDPSVFRKVILE